VELTRRQTLAGGTALGWFLVSGSWVKIAPAQAVESGFEPQSLSKGQCQTLEILAEDLVPGARAAGIAAYVDSQLAAGSNSLLMGKYVGVPTDQQLGFYTAALDAAGTALNRPGASVAAVVRAMADDSVADWQGPPASFFFFLLRADALDVTYGTGRGFAELGIPYMAHITPEEPW
jgi:hypothetical protein